MSGQEYLEAVKAELELGHHQHRMGENILGAFGYVRRRATAIDEINTTLKQIGLVANPPIDSQMPLRSPRIRFGLPTAYESPKGSPGASAVPLASDVSDTHIDDEMEDEEDVNGVLAPSFRISELASANRSVECISPDASIQKAYTTMALNKYSLLVVASSSTPRRQDIKGVVSYQSMAKALLRKYGIAWTIIALSWGVEKTSKISFPCLETVTLYWSLDKIIDFKVSSRLGT